MLDNQYFSICGNCDGAKILMFRKGFDPPGISSISKELAILILKRFQATELMQFHTFLCKATEQY